MLKQEIKKSSLKIRFYSAIKTSLFTLFLLLFFNSAFSAQTGMYAWETILNKIAMSLTGPVAYAIAMIAIVVSGLMMAFADLQGGAKRLVQAACGLSVAFFATQIVTSFLGFSGALI